SDGRILEADLVSVRSLVVLPDRPSAVPRPSALRLRDHRECLVALRHRGDRRRDRGNGDVRGAAAHPGNSVPRQCAATRHTGDTISARLLPVRPLRLTGQQARNYYPAPTTIRGTPDQAPASVALRPSRRSLTPGISAGASLRYSR